MRVYVEETRAYDIEEGGLIRMMIEEGAFDYNLFDLADCLDEMNPELFSRNAEKYGIKRRWRETSASFD